MYEICWIDKADGKHCVTVYPEDKADQMDYIYEGYKHGWITDYDVEYQEETW